MRRSLCIIAVLLVASGCGRLLGSRYDNFTAYYNTFYNAQLKFDEGLTALERSDQPIDRNLYLSIFGQQNRAVQSGPFQEAINKSADVLREHPDSKWVDDALLLIGQSYFYLQNWAGAEQKFREVISLDTKLADEARFWLARSLIASARYEDASAHLAETLAREDLSPRWEPKLYMALVELNVKRERWEEAATLLADHVDAVRDKDVAVRAQFLLGQLYETLGRYDDAVAAYDRVANYKPVYELAYAAQVSAIRVEGTYGDSEEALRRLRRMERDDKNYANRSELAYLRGRIYQTMGRPDDALDTYYQVLYDRSSPTGAGAIRGQVHYALGEFFRDVDGDYFLAAAHFDTASTALRTGARGGQGAPGAAEEVYAPAAITDAQEQARIFNGFVDVMEDIALKDSLLYLGSLDTKSFQEAVLAMRRQKAEELAAQQEELRRRRLQEGFQQSGGFQENQDRQNDAEQTGDAGFLFHRDPVRVQEGIAGFIQRWGERPLVPNWRRRAVFSNMANETLGDEVVVQLNTSERGDAGLPEIDVSAVPRDDVRWGQMRTDRAVARYEMGNVLFLSMNRPDSAATWYRMVIEEDPDEPVARRAYYALAEVQRALGDTLSANRLYRTILNRYPTSEFAGRAREQLGLPQQASITVDSLAMAEAAYAHAYAEWKQQAFSEALNNMLNVAVRYPDTDVAPRALLAAGSIYQEWAARDSLTLFEALPLSVPDSLLQASGLFTQKQAAPADENPEGLIGDESPALLDRQPQRPDEGRRPVDENPVNEVDLPAHPVAAESDSTATPVDSLAMAAVDTLAVPTDSAVVAEQKEPEEVRLETLYASVVNVYPGSPQAEQARRILSALDERRPKPPVDSLAVDSTFAEVSPDSALAAQPKRPRREQRVGDLLDRGEDSDVMPQDTTAIPDGGRDIEAPRPFVDDAAPVDSAGVQPAEPIFDTIEPSQGGWLVVLKVIDDMREAGTEMQNFERLLFSVDSNYHVSLYPAPRGSRQIIGIGLFASEVQAREVLAYLAEIMPPEAEVLYLSARE